MFDFKKLLISPEATILEAIKVINDSVPKVCLIVKEGSVLVGIVTDADIRKGLLSGGELNQMVSSVMNTRPIWANVGTPKAEILKLMKTMKVSNIPIVSKGNVVVGIEYSPAILQTEEKLNHVVLMAGGLGSRLGELTSECPKPMLKVGSKPILETILENFKDHGFKSFYFSVNYKSAAIEDYFEDGSKWGVEIKYLKESSRLGTAGSLSLYQEFNERPIIVMNGDLLTSINLTKLLEIHATNKSDATMGVREYKHQVPFGVIVGENEKILKIEEKPVYSYLVNGGVYVLNPDILRHIPEGTFYDMPTFFQTLISMKYNVGYYPIQEYWLDIGRKDDFDKAHNDFQKIQQMDLFK